MIQLPVSSRVKRVIIDALKQISKEDPQRRFQTTVYDVEVVKSNAFTGFERANIQLIFPNQPTASPSALGKGTEDRAYRQMPFRICYFAEGIEVDPDLITDIMVADIRKALPPEDSPEPLVDPAYANGTIYTKQGPHTQMFSADGLYMGVYAEWTALYWHKLSDPTRWDDEDPGAVDDSISL